MDVKAFMGLTLNLLMTTIVAPSSNVSKWQMGFISAFKGLNRAVYCSCKILQTLQVSYPYKSHIKGVIEAKNYKKICLTFNVLFFSFFPSVVLFLLFLPAYLSPLSVSSIPFPFLFSLFLSRFFHLFFPCTLVPCTSCVFKTISIPYYGPQHETYDKRSSDPNIHILGNKPR
jgi:hypothetical protein